MDDHNTPSMRELRKEKAMETDRLDILDAASRLFASQGVENTSMSDIADETGFSVGKIYKFFPSKKSLFLHIAENYLEQLHTAILQANNPNISPVDRIKNVMEAGIEVSNSGPDQVLMHLRESPNLFVELKRPYREIHKTTFEKLLSEGISSGQLKPHNPQYVAIMLIGAVDALFSHLVESGKPKPFSPITTLIFDHLLTPLMTESKEVDKEKNNEKK